MAAIFFWTSHTIPFHHSDPVLILRGEVLAHRVNPILLKPFPVKGMIGIFVLPFDIPCFPVLDQKTACLFLRICIVFQYLDLCCHIHEHKCDHILAC